MLHFKVLIEQDEDGLYVGSVPELPGCYSQAKTIEQLRQRMKEVILLVLEADKDVRQAKLKSPNSLSRFFGIEDFSINYA
ncbi:MAG: type II toxin-antitoxin system HicB family antitoxin [Patescibacteria group bacterium]|nr:type II toxin-antitoxin system HicB family antitoxin [Patescibacteria group bacterium]